MLSEAANNLKFIQSKIQEINAAIVEASEKGCPNGDRNELEKFEKAVRLLTSELADWIMARQLQELLVREDTNFKIKEITRRKKLMNHGIRTVMVRLSGGTAILFVVSYWITRKDDKRRKREKGLYPALLYFGIYDHCSPLLLAEVSQLCVALGSMEESQRLLKERGVHLDIKTIRNGVKRFARRARTGQKALSEMIFANDKLKGSSSRFSRRVERFFRNLFPRGPGRISGNCWLKGHRVVISMDGGRLRIRKTKRGPKTKKGRAHYSTDWREPKLLIIYVVGEQGRIDKEFSPVIDGTL